ncbi:hypothetical protein DH2020_003706 [Rehmannia glutinosa]|uniref:TPX2 C-terminal domain-containing protein n=1 Tax=Rehmannia glutinosa TaxID=99300 RepID=A0ABR0XMJ5_REHGL
MGESSACLVRSFSQPSPTSFEEKRGNPLQRALTTSISFGRFMSESLDWEKWSAFTHNRHLEEVEKYSKPGSVAEKKAYFEAHFKRRRAAALLEQQNAAANDISETNTEIKVEDINSSSDLDLAQRDSYAVVENTKEGEVQNSDPLLPVGQSGSCDASNERMSEDAQLGESEKVTEQPYLMENPVELTKHLENDERVGDIASKKEDKDDSAKRNSASLSEKKSEVSSSKLSTTSKCATFVKPIMPIQLKNSIKTPDSKKNAMDSSNKRRSYTTSLHMSINFDSCSGETRKATSPGLPKTANPRLVRAPAKKYKNSMLPQTSTRASVNGKYKHHSATPPAENRRTITPQGDSKSGSRTVDWKVQSPSPNYSKSLNTFGGKARLSTASSSFTFKSEERAAKRKEFFQKLEQKSKSKETEKHELHAKSQVKARSSFNDLRNSVVSKATTNAEVPPRTELPSNLTKKIPTVRPSFPKIEERASFKVHGNDSRPPWRLSVKTEGLKDVTEKNSRLSAKCFSKKSNENASPNIQV